jgi:hypothetical protein
MNSTPPARIPASLEPALRRLKAAAVAACERTVESLGLSALSAGNVFLRDSLLAAQFELNHKSVLFGEVFSQTADERVRKELRLDGGPSAPSPTHWDTVSLVDHHELEVQVSAERFGQALSQGCEWELRELDGFVGALRAAAGTGGIDTGRNPLRPETIGYAVTRAIEAVSDRNDVRRILESEFARSFGATMSMVYTGVIADLRAAGLQPAGMTVRVQPESPAAERARMAQAAAGLDFTPGGHDRSRQPSADHTQGAAPRPNTRAGAFYDSSRSAGGGTARGRAMGEVDAGMMTLMRRLVMSDRASGATSSHGPLAAHDTGAPAIAEVTAEGLHLAAPNVIRAHRDALRQASAGPLDHRVIDIIGSLFDQILSDPKVPPQIARQIGRLQLPVLRAALGDPAFFSSRAHPVRRFINRMASLATALENLDDERGRRFLKLVRELVQGIVDGEFERAETYEKKLATLEHFVAEQARLEVTDVGDAPALLAEREDQARVQHRLAQRLQAELQPLTVPDFVRDFLAKVWSRVLIKANRESGSDSPSARRMRHAGRELFMSVQPKAMPAQRKEFLAQLPRLMQELNEGMNLIGWPEPAKKAFFGQLLPAHAESIKGEGMRTLDFNLLAREVDQIFEKPVVTQDELPVAADPMALTEDTIVPNFTAEEVRQIGLVTESAVDWSGEVDVNLGAEPSLTEVDITIDGMPAPEPVEPTRGKSLADHVQIGFAYEMQLAGEWQKVRLNHVSPARTFYVFTQGQRHKKTISFTHRMLVRLCESGRLRALENAYLLERATARARRQLAGLSAQRA